jgi:beta-glucuronidase
MPRYAGYSGIGWYRRAFRLPSEAARARVTLRFGAVFYLARVWLNGRYLGAHEGGYTPFALDPGRAARAGATNVLVVQVDNRRAEDRLPATLGPGSSYDWWNDGGIVRDVAVEVTSRASIAAVRIVAVPHLTGPDEADRADVTVTVRVENASDQPLRGRVVAGVDGQSATADVRAAPGRARTARLRLVLGSPRLWHFDHPNLYRLTTKLLAADRETLHQREETFGIRAVDLRDARVYLNGEPVRLVGLTRHEDSPAHGLAETTEVMSTDYEDLKRVNEVLSRPVHYPQPDFVLDYCDAHGILLVPEVPAWQLTREQMASPHMRSLERRQLREMIASEANHPSVWAWSVGNELDSQSVEGWRFVRDMIRLVKALDPTRPVGFASNHLNEHPELDATRFADLVLMNEYFGSWSGPEDELGPALDRVHAAWPDKPVIVSEFGLEPHWYRLSGQSDASLDRSRYFFAPANVAADSDAADAERRRLIGAQMDVFRSRPFVAGAIYWTYADYRTPTHFVMGVVDAERRRRGSWEVLRREYSPVEMLRAAISGRSAIVELRTRGPLGSGLPAYTLRGYTLRWSVRSADGKVRLGEGEVPLPTLPPGSGWSGRIDGIDTTTPSVLELAVIRPSGIAALERAIVVGS